MLTYPRKLWRQRKHEQPRRDLADLGRQVEELWPILEILDGPGFMLADHIGLLLYTDRVKATKSANERLARLFRLGVIDAFRMSRSNMPTRGGAAPLVYCLTKTGAQLLAAHRQVSISDLQWRDGQELLSMSTICHRLDLVDLHVALQHHCRQSGMTLTRYQYEPRYELPRDKEWLAVAEGGKELCPDALAEIEGSSGRWSLFIELDRNTERPRRFAERAGRYEVFYRSAEWERWLTEAPTVLVVATEGGRARAQSLRKTTADALTECKFRRWRFAGAEDLYQVERSRNGYTAPVQAWFDRPVCRTPGDDTVSLLGGGNE